MKKIVSNLVILIMISLLLILCPKMVNAQQSNTDVFKVSQSQDGKKEIYCNKDKELILKSGNIKKVIYQNYRDVTTNPYSIWSFDEYKIQWSSDGDYVYIIDSVYDLKNDKLIPLKDCVVFSWIGNKGVYLAEGNYYEISYDGALQNEMAVGKKIKVIENGKIQEKGKQTDNRYFVLDHFIDVDKVFKVTGDYITINTALLKYSEEELQGKIDEDMNSNKFREFFYHNNNESLNIKYAELIKKIKESKEFDKLQKQIQYLEKNYPIEVEGDIKELIRITNDLTYGFYNVSGRYYLKDIKKEEVEIVSQNEETLLIYPKE